MSSNQSSDKRQYPRYVVESYADVSGEQVGLNHKVCNISLGGLCLQTSTLEVVGSIVDLVINFPELDESLGVRGEVVWANREPPADMGIRFVKLDDEEKTRLAATLERQRALEED